MKRKNSNVSSENENPFSFSIGDLMAGVLFIFVLLLASSMLEIQEKAERDAEIASRYNNIKSDIYFDIAKEFKDDLAQWNAVVDENDLSIRFSLDESGTKVSYFDSGRPDVKQEFKDVLDEFFPKYLRLIANPKYRDSIEEIRIEGHTDSNGGYMLNVGLSQGRARNVLDYCLQIAKNDPDLKEMMEWAQYKITANGLSYSHPILNADGSENKDLSRRVEFKVRTNAEAQLEEIAKMRQ
jgi:outer membrane protein OmpA-like peptidoglycan-associated protein